MSIKCEGHSLTLDQGHSDVNIYVPPPTKGCGGGGGGAYCFWDGSHWCQHKTVCPLCNLNTLWNILMILGINADHEEMMCHIQD